MKNIAIVVQRCHEQVIGGSEAEAWHYANLLKNNYNVHILTTTSVDFASWDNVLDEGDEIRKGICIKRFKVTQGRADYWAEIYGQVLKEYGENINLENKEDRLIKWPVALQEEFIYKQGPYSDDLMGFLSKRSYEYKAIIFLTYLYPTTYFGMFEVPGEKIVFVPTLHDEPPAYLSVYRHIAKRSRIILWNTDSECRFGRLLWGELPCCVVGMGVETKEFPPAKFDFPYILYCGRIDSSKGCPLMIEYFLKYKKYFPSDLHLVLTGDNKIELPATPDIVFKGCVSEEEKFKLMGGASFFVMPSPNESFSIVTLEAMAQSTPVLANSGSEAVAGHIRKSGGGMLYGNYDDFKDGVNFLLENGHKAKDMGENGRKYVMESYGANKISGKLNDIIEAIE